MMFRMVVAVAALLGLVTAGQANAGPQSVSHEPVTVQRTHTPPAAPLYLLSWMEATEVAGASGVDAWSAFVAAGATGATNDGTDDTLYVPVGTVVELGYGTATMSVYGLAFCVDAPEQRCSGGEFLTDGYLGEDTTNYVQV